MRIAIDYMGNLTVDQLEEELMQKPSSEFPGESMFRIPSIPYCTVSQRLNGLELGGSRISSAGLNVWCLNL